MANRYKKLAALAMALCMLTGTALAQDGTFTGVGMGRNGEIQVEVTLEQGALTAINVVSHVESPVISDNALTLYPQAMVEQQSLTVDMVSGATLTSAGVRLAVQDALKNAGAEVSKFQTKVDVKAEIAEPVDAKIGIIGGGVAGLTAAVRALQLGEKVVLFEMNGFLGGSCAVASGQICGTPNRMQQEAGILDDNADIFYDNLVELNGGAELPYPELSRRFVDKSGEMIDWLDEYLNVDFGTRVPGLGLYTPPNRARIFHTNGGYSIVRPMIEKLQEAVEAGNATLYMNTEVTRLIQDETGAVTGVVVKDENGGERSYSFEATILACGGYCHNQELLKTYNYTNVCSSAPKGSVGSNIKFAEQVGAQLALLNKSGTYPGAIPEIGFDARYAVRYTYPGSIAVNNEGSRYCNEQSTAVVAGYVRNDANEVFIVFNQALRDETQNILQITGYNEAMLTAEESWAIFDQLEAFGRCVYKADTVAELSEKMGVDAVALEATIARYNGFAETGVDEDFGRPVMAALSEGPYYAVYSIPYVLQTAGGILINADAAVLDAQNEVIGGLYACGEAVGMNLAVRPSHGGKSIGMGTIFGMIAAETAVQAVK